MSAEHRRFAVTCKCCGLVVFRVAELTDPEIAILVEHLAQCAPRFRRAASLGDVLQHVHVSQAAE